MSRPRVFVGAFVHSLGNAQAEYTDQGLIGVDASGVIALVERNVHDAQIETVLAKHGWLLSDVDIVTLKHGEFVLPGFIDTHTHAPQYPNLGRGQQFELLDWLTNITFPTEARFSDLDYARQVYQSVVERVIASGTTTCCYYGTLHTGATSTLADIVHSKGQRAFIGKCNMDRNAAPDYQEASASQSIADTETLIKHIRSLQGTLVTPILTPRFAISCTSELLGELGKLATSDPALPIQTHISENANEIEFTLSLFPECKHYAGVYDQFGLLRENTILAHACHLGDEEIELVKSRKAGISHCPTSNFHIRSGLAPVGRYLDKGIKVGLGTDVSGGYAPSILSAIRHASICSKVIAMAAPTPPNPSSFANKQLPIPTLLFLSTLGGAQVCNLEHKIGNFVPGKEFDALVVSLLPPTANPGVFYTPGDDLDTLVERFLFCGDDRNIRQVYVAGKLIGGAGQA